MSDLSAVAVKSYLKDNRLRYYYFEGSEPMRDTFDIMQPVHGYVARNLCTKPTVCTDVKQNVETDVFKSGERYVMTQRIHKDNPLHGFLADPAHQVQMLSSPEKSEATKKVMNASSADTRKLLESLRTDLEQTLSRYSFECIKSENMEFEDVFNKVQEYCFFAPLYKLDVFIGTKSKKRPETRERRIDVRQFEYERIYQVKGHNYFCLRADDVREYDLGNTQRIANNYISCRSGFETQGFTRDFPYMTTDVLQYKSYLVRALVTCERLREVIEDERFEVRFGNEQDRTYVLATLEKYIDMCRVLLENFAAKTDDFVKRMSLRLVQHISKTIPQTAESFAWARQALSASFHISYHADWIFYVDNKKPDYLVCVTHISEFEHSLLALKYDHLVYKLTPALRRWRLVKNLVRSTNAFSSPRFSKPSSSPPVVVVTPVVDGIPVAQAVPDNSAYYRKVATIAGMVILGSIAAYTYRYDLGLATPPLPPSAYDLLMDGADLIKQAVEMKLSDAVENVADIVGIN